MLHTSMNTRPASVRELCICCSDTWTPAQMTGLEWVSRLFLPFLVMIYSCSPQQSPGLGLSGCSVSQNTVRWAADSKPTTWFAWPAAGLTPRHFFFFFFLMRPWCFHGPEHLGKGLRFKAHWSFSSSFKMQPLHIQVFTWCMCVYQLYTHTKLSLPNVQYCV